MRSLWITFAGALLLAGLAAVVSAQSFFGSIVGTAVAESGAAIPQAMVTLTNTETGETKTASTDQAGNYQFLNLIPGLYKVDLEKAGFKRVTKDAIRVTVQAAVRADVTMEIGTIGQIVEVSASAVSLQTETATLSQAVEAGTSPTCL